MDAFPTTRVAVWGGISSGSRSMLTQNVEPITISSLFNATTLENEAFSGATSTAVVHDPSGPKVAAVLVPILFTIIVCVGIVGNSLVITVMTKMHKQSHGQGPSNTNRFILNLAISDLLFLIFCVPFHIPVYTLDEWVFGGFMCKMSKFFEVMAMISSVYSMVALSVDRFLAVVYATSARQVRTRTNAIRGLIFIWIASIGIAAPKTAAHLYVRVNNETLDVKLCVPTDEAWERWYQVSLLVLGYISPLLVVICCYMGLLMKMIQNSRKSTVTKNSSTNDARKRVTRIVFLVVLVFSICWFPYHLFHMYRSFGSFQFNSSTFVLVLVQHCMSYANSCLNPLVYAFVSKKFRNDFKKAFTCQYFTEAVVSMKALSQRMIGSVGGTLRFGPRSRMTGTGEASVENVPARGTVARTIQQRHAFCPRSPVMCYAPPNTAVTVPEPTSSDKDEERTCLFHDGGEGTAQKLGTGHAISTDCTDV